MTMTPNYAAAGCDTAQPSREAQTSFDFISTTCLHLGRPCPAADRMVRALAKALDMSKGSTEQDFEIQGESQLDGCEHSCPARFQARHDRIRVFCKVEGAADMAELNQFADAMLSPFPAPITTKVTPGSFAEARPKPALS